MSRIFTKCSKDRKKVRCTCGRELTKKELVRLAFDAIHVLKDSGVTVRDVVEFTGVGRTIVQEVLVKEYKKIGSFKDSKYVKKNLVTDIINEEQEVYDYKVVEVGV